MYLGCSIGLRGGHRKPCNILSYILMGYHIEASPRFVFFQGGDQVYLGYSVNFVGGVRKTRNILSHLAGFKFFMVL